MLAICEMASSQAALRTKSLMQLGSTHRRICTGGPIVKWIMVSLFPLVLVGCSQSPSLPISQPISPTASTDHHTAVDMARVTAIEIFPETATLRIGQSESLSVFVVLSAGIPPSGPAPFWSSTNPSVATVDANGLVRAQAVGNTAVEVRFKGVSASRLFSVVP
jgi:uncharacterized protein YjdB